MPPRHTRTTVLVDREKTDKLDELGFNISSICRAAIDQALDVSNEDLIFEIRIRLLDDEIVVQSGREQDLAISLDYCRDKLKHLKIERERLIADSIRAIEVSKYSVAKNRVNRIILAAHYDMDAIRSALETEGGKQIIEEMIRLEPTFSIDKQVIVLKDLMES